VERHPADEDRPVRHGRRGAARDGVDPPFGTFPPPPESPANIAPSPQANEVGFFRPVE
jgi:hypothetical protein